MSSETTSVENPKRKYNGFRVYNKVLRMLAVPCAKNSHWQ